MYGPATGPTPPYTPPAAPYTEPGPYGSPPNPAPHPGYAAQGAHAACPTTPDGWFGRGYAVGPQRRSTAARVGLLLLRVLLACLPLVSIGMLCWVPLVWTASVRRRWADWAALAVTLLLTVLGFYMIASTPDTDNGESDAGLALMLLLIVASTAYFLTAELRQLPLAQTSAPLVPYAPYGPHAPHWPPASTPPPTPAQTPTPTPTPIVPLGQVQAELDELSALLRRHAGTAP
jgi:hypothetical protein